MLIFTWSRWFKRTPSGATGDKGLFHVRIGREKGHTVQWRLGRAFVPPSEAGSVERVWEETQTHVAEAGASSFESK